MKEETSKITNSNDVNKYKANVNFGKYLII